MAEYLIQGETLTSMADKIRILSGTEETMTTAQMDGKLGEANTEVDTQADLIAQITSALEDKAGGSGGGSGSVDLCSVEIITLNRKTNCMIHYTNSDMNYFGPFKCVEGILNIPKHTFVAFVKGDITPSGNYGTINEISGVYILYGDCTFTVNN